MKKSTKVECSSNFFVNVQGPGLRNAIGHALRWLAREVDGRHNLCIEFQTVPQLTREQQRECMMQGIQSMQKSAWSEVTTEGLELMLQAINPALYVEDSEK